MEFLGSTKCDDIFDVVEDAGEEIQDVHIWLRQRTGRKYITEVEGLASDLDLKKISKCWRHEFHCSVTKTRNKKGNKVIILQGNKTQEIENFLIEEKIIKREKIKNHGY